MAGGSTVYTYTDTPVSDTVSNTPLRYKVTNSALKMVFSTNLLKSHFPPLTLSTMARGVLHRFLFLLLLLLLSFPPTLGNAAVSKLLRISALRGRRGRSASAAARARDWPTPSDHGPQPPTPGDLALDVANCLVEDCDPNCLCEKIVWESDFAGPGPPAMYAPTTHIPVKNIKETPPTSLSEPNGEGKGSAYKALSESSSIDYEIKAAPVPHPNWASQPVPGVQTNICDIWAQRGRLNNGCAPTCQLIYQQVDAAQGADPNVCYKAAAEARAFWKASGGAPGRLGPPALPAATTTTPPPRT